MMMMMMMSVVICDEIYRILFKNNVLPSPVFSGPFSSFSSFFLRVGKKDLLLGQGRRESLEFSPFFSLSEAESDVNFTLFL